MVNIVEMNPFNELRRTFHSAWKRNKILTFLTVLVLIGFVFSAAGLVLDPRQITGVPRWLKPAKFAISMAIYTGTLVWLLGQVTIWQRLIRRLFVLTGWLVMAEVALIDLQAARGTTSHFNVSTTFDATVFSVMGTMITVVWAISALLFVALCLQRFESRAWGTALRAGVLLSVLGAGTGGVMLRPTPAQLAGMRQAAPSTVGAHTIGGQDGGPGLPVTGWSTEHGDLRVPHFVGLHGMQIIPLFAWLLTKATGWPDRRRRGFVLVASLSYLALFVMLLWQALNGYSIFSTNETTVGGWVVWLVVTVAAFAFASVAGSPKPAATNAGVEGAN
jgi:hypothetical protein